MRLNSGISAARDAGWLAGAVPVFVQGLNSQRDVLGKSQLAGNGRAPLTAGLDQSPRYFRAVLDNVEDRAESLGQAGFDPRVREDKAQDFRQAAVEPFEILLEDDVVCEIKLANPCGVAAAAKVFQKQRIVEIAQTILGETDFEANLRPDEAAADAVPGGLAFGHVQGMAQGGEKLAKPDLARNRKTG